MYKFYEILPYSQGNALLSHYNETKNLWHDMYGHLNYRYLQALCKDNMVEGLPTINFSNGTRKGCVVGKHAELCVCSGKACRARIWERKGKEGSPSAWSNPSISHRASSHNLIWEFKVCVYFHIWFVKVLLGVFSQAKIWSFETFEVWKALVENACGNKIKVLRTENGKEYVNNNFQHLCE